MTTKSNSGGARPGAGRKPKPASEHAIKGGHSLPPELHAHALALGDGNISRGLQIALAESLRRSKRK